MQSKSINLNGTYLINQKVLEPYQPSGNPLPYKVLILPSKYEGRSDYLAIKVQGNNKPVFISTIYEARTSTGWFNFEHKGVRYEVVKESDLKAVIFEYKVGKKGVTIE
jgi:hypothetical protein